MPNTLLIKAKSKTRYELPVFIMLLIQLIPQNLDFSEDTYSSMLVLDYRLGFAPRLLPGSVLALFTDYRGRVQINIFYAVVFLLSYILVAWIAGRLIRAADEDMKKTMVFFVVLFFACPFSNAFLFPQLYSPDRFLVLFTLAGLLFIGKHRLKWLLPFVAFFAMATHPMFAFAYMPLIFILVVYELYRSGFSKESAVFCVINFIAMAASTVYFYSFSGLKNISLQEILLLAQAKTDIPVRAIMFETFILRPSLDVIGDLKDTFLLGDVLDSELRAAVFILPIIILFFFVWKNAIKKSESKFEKFIFILCCLVPLARIPLFFTTTELYRGRIAMILTQFFLLFYFLYSKNNAVTGSVRKIGEFFERNILVMMFVVAYLAMAFSTLFFPEPWKNLFSELLGLKPY
jgi:hypothetical protein